MMIESTESSTPPKDASKNPLSSKVKYILLILFPILIAMGTFIYFKGTKKKSKTLPIQKTFRKVRFFKGAFFPVQRVAVGYGNAIPHREWSGYCEVKGRILCLGFSLFRKEDFKNLSEFIKELRDKKNSLSRFLVSQFSEFTKELLQKYTKNSSFLETFQYHLVHELNHQIRRGYFYSPALFGGITFSKKIQKLIQKRPLGQDLLYLNRKLLERAYPKFLQPCKRYSLSEGSFLPRGAIIYEIDPMEYFLVIEQKNILIQKNKIQIQELEEEKKYLEKNLLIEKKRLVLLKDEYKRKEKESKSNVASASDVERELNKYLSGLNQVEFIKNSLQILPMKISNLKASLQMAYVDLRQSEINLSRTRIRAPFNLRVTLKKMEINQPVSPGQLLIQGYGIDFVEVVGQFQMKDLQDHLFPKDYKWNFQDFLEDGIESKFQKFKIQGQIELMGNPSSKNLPKIMWKGQLTRIQSSMEQASQTVSVVILVKDPYKNVIPGIHPPLVKGMYCKITLLGEKMSSFVIPRSAYHQGKIYLLEGDSLVIRSIDGEIFQDGYVLVQKGLEKGEKIILSDIFPAIPGLKLKGSDTTKKVIKNHPWFVHQPRKNQRRSK